jgi:hypothetical protein
MERVESGRVVGHVLDLDPDLAKGVPATEHDHARQRAVALVLELGASHWHSLDFSAITGSGSLGLYVADGLLLRRITIASRASGELFGPGDILRPWDSEVEQYAPLTIAIDWLVLKPARLAVLDQDFARRIARWPGISTAITERAAERAGRLALRTAIAHLTHADMRLLLIFWLLATRWGTVTTDGIRVKLPLTHEILAMLVGHQRPTVTLGLQKLAQRGLLIRRSSDDWLLTAKALQALNEA